MIRNVFVGTALIVGSFTSPASTMGAARHEWQTAQVTAADAAPFLGDWTLNLQGQNGPATLDLAVKVEKDKVVGEIKGGELPAQPILDITRAEKTLVLRYTFDYQGTPVPAIVSLTPGEDGKGAAEIDFAGGAYVMSGTAAKKEKAK
jgi:hypothetical protein